ncbi:MAG: outer membrane protein assembly factor BamD [Planctomycetota bacterium]
MPRYANNPARVPLAVLLMLSIVGVARAQSLEYTLEDDIGWTAASAPEPGTDEALIADARRLLAEGKPKRARSILSDWIDVNKRSVSPLLPQAYLLRGDADLASGREFRALFDYEAVIRDFPASPEFATAVEREFDIGVRYLSGLKRRFLGTFRFEDARTTGEELLIRVQERLPGSALAERAAIFLADFYYDRRELDLAGEMYGIFLVNYPRSRHTEHARLRQIFCNVARFKGPSYDGAGLLEARLLIENYAARHPGSADIGLIDGLSHRIDEAEAAQRYQTAMWYLKRNDEPSARLTLRRLVRNHPRSAAAREALNIMTDRGWIEAPVRDTSDLLAPADEPANPPAEQTPDQGPAS